MRRREFERDAPKSSGRVSSVVAEWRCHYWYSVSELAAIMRIKLEFIIMHLEAYKIPFPNVIR